MSQILFTNATLACLDTESGYGLREHAALLVEDDRIRWLGAADACPVAGIDEVVDCGQRLLTPGLIDCHTHLVYGGDRADEFEQRLEGASYAEIAARGGGILATVKATRGASEAELIDSARPRLQALLREGVTTVEIKSGYGLDCDTEIRMLRAARALAEEFDINLQTTYLGAHALPPEYHGRADDYIDLICDQILPAAHSLGLVDAVDVFIESIAFTRDQGERVLRCARRLGLPVKAHAEQLSDMGGAAMAADLGALSVDHLEYLSAVDVAAIAKNEAVAVLLPGAFYVLQERHRPPIEDLRRHGVPLALATDANPGSSPIHSLQLIMNMGCNLFALTPAEALRGVTVNAARALGMNTRLGTLEIGKQADIVLWDVTSPAMLSYRIGVNPCHAVMRRGRWRQPPRREVA